MADTADANRFYDDHARQMLAAGNDGAALAKIAVHALDEGTTSNVAQTLAELAQAVDRVKHN